jgi:hypothetical protein
LLLIPKNRIKLNETLVNKRRGLVKFSEAVFFSEFGKAGIICSYGCRYSGILEKN